MKCKTYKATPGLDRFPEGQRFTVYRSAHKKLMREDRSYRKHFILYVTAVVVFGILPGAFWAGASSLGKVASTVHALAPAAIILCLALSQQRYMNRCIGSVLQSETP
ncbi:hypothetical protein [Roseimicrobium sp. ORNL1]|uniref:hypothetical protein n=1 Tax=Roseimicrobium sp. ORNL1 TaxID=2711231 RepID=UPI0013E12D20|nr:hypothetical protein [Roseimicrobium sp. ORNL1]QIF02754.1 hypothetical protein G5S37_14895 [Roseimicrobium sp. ORNL1]